MNSEPRMIKVAAYTRGWEIDFTWKASWLDSSDRVPDRPIREELGSYSLNECVRTDDPGVVISKRGNSYALLLCGLATDYKASRPGFVSTSFAFFDLEERPARILAVAILRDWHSVSKQLVLFISRPSPPSDPEWSIDVDGLSRYAESVIKEPAQGGKLYHGRRGLPYAQPGDPRFMEFAEMLAEQSFSPKSGVKVLIGRPFSDARADILQSQADLIALPGLARYDEPSTRRPEESPSGLKNVIMCIVSNILRWIISNRGLSIAIVGALLVLGIAKCQKKKSLRKRRF